MKTDEETCSSHATRLLCVRRMNLKQVVMEFPTCECVESTVRIAAALANRRSLGPSYREQDLAVAARTMACVTVVKK